MLKRKPVAVAVAAALGVSSFGGIGSVALAQGAADETLEEIITTGSRIVTEDGFGRTSPVTVMTANDISSLGLTRVEDVLNSLPSVETALHSFDANGITGTASIDLRGLGSFRTLVLMNGRRMQPGGVTATSVDVNQIPSAMIERIEVLTDSIVFGIVNIPDSVSNTFIISNTNNALLVIDSLVTSGVVFSATVESDSIFPGESKTVTAVFKPDSTIVFLDSISIFSSSVSVWSSKSTPSMTWKACESLPVRMSSFTLKL